MDLLFEIIVECMIGLITDDAIDIMNDSGRTGHLSKGMKVVIVAAAILILLTVTGLLLLVGISNLSEGNVPVGIFITLLAAAVPIYCVLRFVLAYKKKRKSK